MFCPNCGGQSPDGTKFCPYCGSNIADNQQPTNNQANYNQPNYSQPDYNQQGYVQPQNYTQPPMYNFQPTMKWYKFLIYFGLFAGAVVNCLNAILYITGLVYGSQYGSSLSEFIYYVSPAMKYVDIIYGIMLIPSAALQIFTRFQLSGFKKNGPKLIIAVYAVELVTSLFYLIATSLVCGASTFNASTITSLIVIVVMIILNRIYFNKRKDMFVN